MRAHAIAAGTLVFLAAATSARAQSRHPKQKPAPARERAVVATFSGHLTGPLADAPDRLSREMVGIIDASGGQVRRAALDDILTLAGCGEPSDDCLQQALDLLEVRHLVVGELEPAASGQIRVRLRLIAASTPARSRSFLIAGESRAALVSAFRVRARAFWRDPDLIDVDFDAAPARISPDAAAPPVDALPEAGFSARRVDPLAWGVAGGGAGLGLVGGVLLLVAADKQNQVDDAPTETLADFEALVDLEESGRTYARWGTALVVVGAVTSAVGAALVYKQGRELDEAEPAPGASLTLVPSLFAGSGIGAILTLRAVR